MSDNRVHEFTVAIIAGNDRIVVTQLARHTTAKAACRDMAARMKSNPQGRTRYRIYRDGQLYRPRPLGGVA